MTALSILVPDELAQDSLLIAKKMHISRSQFIRMAIEHEIKSYRIKKKQEKMIEGFQSLKNQPGYLAEIDDIEKLDSQINDEDAQWWKK